VSYQTIRRAYEIAGLNKGERAVLVALALHADERDRAFPGQKLLSRYTCYSVRSVQRAIDGLDVVPRDVVWFGTRDVTRTSGAEWSCLVPTL